MDAVEHWLSDSDWIVHVLDLEAVEEPEDAVGGVEVVVNYNVWLILQILHTRGGINNGENIPMLIRYQLSIIPSTS